MKHIITDFKDVSLAEIEKALPCENQFYIKEIHESDEDAKHIAFDLLFTFKYFSNTFDIDIWCDIEPQSRYMEKGKSIDSYDLAARGVYYLARMLSRQLVSGTDTSSYGCLRKCYSIWICFDNLENKLFKPCVTDYRLQLDELKSYGERGERELEEQRAADLLELVIIKLGGNSDNELINFLHALFRDPENLTTYIPAEHECYTMFTKEVSDMCNLGDLREAKGRAEGKVEGKVEGRVEGKAEVAYRYYKEHHNLAEALNITGISIEDLLKYYPELKDELEDKL